MKHNILRFRLSFQETENGCYSPPRAEVELQADSKPLGCMKNESLTEPLVGLRRFVGNSPGDMRGQKFPAPALGDERTINIWFLSLMTLGFQPVDWGRSIIYQNQLNIIRQPEHKCTGCQWQGPTALFWAETFRPKLAQRASIR